MTYSKQSERQSIPIPANDNSLEQPRQVDFFISHHGQDSHALAAFYENGDRAGLDNYSETALRRVWGAVRVSWYLTNLLHRFPNQDGFDLRMQENELGHLASSEAAMSNLAEQYVGLPL